MRHPLEFSVALPTCSANTDSMLSGQRLGFQHDQGLSTENQGHPDL
jgi:hypothetical protein